MSVCHTGILKPLRDNKRPDVYDVAEDRTHSAGAANATAKILNAQDCALSCISHDDGDGDRWREQQHAD